MWCCCSDEKPEVLLEVATVQGIVPRRVEEKTPETNKYHAQQDEVRPVAVEEQTLVAPEPLDTPTSDADRFPAEGFQDGADALLMKDLEGSYWMSDSIPVGYIKEGTFYWTADFGLQDSPISVEASKISVSARSRESAIPTQLQLDLRIVDGHVEEIIWIDGDVWIRDPLHYLWNTRWKQKGTDMDVGEVKGGCIKWADGFGTNESPLSFEGPGRISMKVQTEGKADVETFHGDVIMSDGLIAEIRWSDGDVWLLKGA
eukprot:TRINITY_DN60816_c0_g1_i1.p1 TRINITY_DN60816_c0_g1~~TRINITY_DN60816_c0_g1_i1.p1  ORF type:complete len:258 (-),score=41.61 TRINITY_DN60816_c0_g1_i1:61-834(-)